MQKEAHKIYLSKATWEALVKIANLEGVSIGDLVARLFYDKYAWNTEEVVKEDKKKPNIKDYVLKGVEAARIPKEDYKDYIVLYCKECLYLDIRSRYSVYAWECHNGHKLEPLGSLNNFIT